MVKFLCWIDERYTRKWYYPLSLVGHSGRKVVFKEKVPNNCFVKLTCRILIFHRFVVPVSQTVVGERKGFILCKVRGHIVGLGFTMPMYSHLKVQGNKLSSLWNMVYLCGSKNTTCCKKALCLRALILSWLKPGLIGYWLCIYMFSYSHASSPNKGSHEHFWSHPPT